MPQSQLVLAVHGSAAPEAAGTVSRLASLVTNLGGVRPVVGHLDAQSPSLAHALEEVRAAGHDTAVVVPLLLGDGYHRTVDIPAVVESARDRGLRCVLTDGFSGEVAVAFSLYERLRAAERRAGGGSRGFGSAAKADAIVLASAGSSRPGGNNGAVTAARQLRQLLGGERGPVPVRTGYCSAAGPTVAEAVAELREEGHERIAVATHLLAPGRFTEALRGLARAGEVWSVAAPLADHPRLARLVLRRHSTGRRSLVPHLVA